LRVERSAAADFYIKIARDRSTLTRMSPETIDIPEETIDISHISPSVLRWRFEQLEAAGYPTEEAFVLSERTDIDLHVAVELPGSGCPIPIAIQILI
jgi:hypothetical protein